MQLAGVTRRRQKCRRNGAAGLAKPRSVGPANPSPPCQTQQQPSEWEGGKRVSRICAKGASLRFAAVPTSSSAAHSPPTRDSQKAAQHTASTSTPLFCLFTRTLFGLLKDGQPTRTLRRKSWARTRVREGLLFYLSENAASQRTNAKDANAFLPQEVAVRRRLRRPRHIRRRSASQTTRRGEAR